MAPGGFDQPQATRADRARHGRAAEAKRLPSLRNWSKKVRENADYVGDRFAEEARKIHFGEADPRGIYGEATLDEAKSLAEDGVEFLPIPAFPDDRN